MNAFVKALIHPVKEFGKWVTYHLCTWISRRIDFFHYKLLTCYNYPIYSANPANGIIGNKCYGNLWAIKNAEKEHFHPHCMIEHGLYFGEYVLEDECQYDFIDTIYTYSDYRKGAILKWFNGQIDKNIIPVGPYIIHAHHFYPEKKLKEIKKKLGRVLLVFPSHSSPGAIAEYDVNAFLDKVDELAGSFDTVLVSLFWLDIRRGLDKPYLEKGYRVVCSGIRADRWFLSRQKDLFELADFSMSNDIGTHIGYSVAMGVPHFLFKQKVSIDGYGQEYSSDKHNRIRQKEYNELIDAFGSVRMEITQAQRDIVDYYWGTCSKNPPIGA